jgi:SSS family transporter
MHLNIGAVDCVVLAAYLIVAVALGLWVGRGSRDLAGYVLAGKDLPWWALLGSIVATETSTATFLSVPGLSYKQGGDFRFLQLAMGFFLGRCLVVVLLLPAYFRGDIVSAYEVLAQRFGRGSRWTASALFLVARNLGDGLRLFLAAIALERAVGLSLTACIVLISAVTIVYTLFGGMRSVVWNDCLQFAVYMVGGIVALLIIVGRIPGHWQHLHAFAMENHKLRLFDFTWDQTSEYTFLAGIIGGAFLTLGTHGTDQLMVQRYLAARSFRDAARALILSGVVVIVQFALFLLVGIALACFFQQFPAPEAIERGDAAFAEFIVHHMPRGLAGLTLAAVFAAAMSTLSSSLNSSATVAVCDFGSFGDTTKSSTNGLLWCKRMTVVFGVIQIAVAVAAQYYSESVVKDALAIAGLVAGMLLGVFLLGTLTRRVGEAGAMLGMLCGLAGVAVAKFATDVAWPWYSVIGAVTTFAFGWLISLVWPERGKP